MRKIVAILLVLGSGPALAQQENDPVFLHRAIAALQSQRNQALDALVVSEARAAGLADELAKANARPKETETKQEPKPD